MKKLVVILLLLSSFGSIAQTYQENLEKYWYFRHRLREEFMFFSANASSPGSHMPAECRSDTLIPNNRGDNYEQHFIRWGDGVWWLGHYMAVLALEYRLLKDNNQDYNGTLNELIQALNTYDRLDLVIEGCFANGCPEWNGFFARDDIPASNDQFFPKSLPNDNPYLTIASDYYNHCDSATGGNVPSQDQIISLFLGLRLVNALVNEPDVNEKVREIAGAVIDRMHHSYSVFNLLGMSIVIQIWEIKNPVTGNVVPLGGGLFELYMQIWAMVEVAGDITTHNEHKFYSDDARTKETWDNVQNTILIHFDEGPNVTIPIWIFVPLLGTHVYLGDYTYDPSPFNAYMIAVLSALCNEPGGGYSNTYEWLVNFNNDTKGFLGMPGDIGLYPQLPLINRILYGYNGSNLISANEYETKFLNNAPPCGAHHYVYQNNGVTIDEVTSPPWHTVSLGCPQHNKGGWGFDGEYNMIDYMILYNAYFMNYFYGERDHYLLVKGDYPEEEFEIEFDDWGHPDTVGSYFVSTCNEPKALYASRQIDTKTNILADGGLNCFAGSSIRMLPDFKVETGGCFKAVINSTMLENFYYQETNINTCAGGSFSPLINMEEGRLTQQSLPYITFYKEKDTTINTKTAVNNETKKIISQNIESGSNHVNSYLKVFPNPSSGLFTINCSTTVKSIYIYNTYGLVVLSNEEVNQNSLIFDLVNQPRGVYFLKVQTTLGLKTLKVAKM